MYLTYVRKAIGFQWVVAAIVAITALFVSGPRDTTTDMSVGGIISSALNTPITDFFGMVLVLAFVAALIFFGSCLAVTGKHSKLCSSTIIALFFSALWLLEHTIAVPVRGWFPHGEATFTLWFTMMLPVELAVIEILLPPYGFWTSRQLAVN